MKATNIETVYTLEEARKIIEREEYERKRTIIRSISSRMLGFGLVLIGILTPVILDGDATFSVFAIPYGIYQMLHM